MRLSKLFCNQSGFKDVTFNLNGLNVIYADVSTNIAEKKNSHDLGKTKFGELIDFLLLKKISNYQKHFLFKIHDGSGNSVFLNHVFYLELFLNSGKFLTIKRTVDTNTKISFAVSEQRNKGYLSPTLWEHEDIAIDKARECLSEYLNFDFFYDKPYDFRKAISYSLRLQGDYEDVYKLSKFVGGKDRDWKPFMFDLLGFDGQILRRKYENDEERDKIKTYISQLKKEFSINADERDDIVAQIKILEQETQKIEAQIDSFNFYEQDKELIKKGIEDIETSISDLNSQSYLVNYEIEKLHKSVKNKFAFNVDKIKEVFSDAQIYFPDQLVNDYKELIIFNQKLTTERNKLLKDTLLEKEVKLDEINSNLKNLNQEKEDLLAFLKDTDAFKKFKHYQKQLASLQSNEVAFQNQLKNIDLIIAKDSEIQDLLKEVESTIRSLKEIFQHTEDNQRYSEIRTTFSSYYKSIMDEDARISWKINDSNNVDFVPPKVKSKVATSKESAKDEGNTYRKMLCVAFDLAVLTTFFKESYFRFVYHDDVLSQQDNGIKTRLVKLLNDLSLSHQIQFIISAIKADLPISKDHEPIYFTNKETILKLHDKDSSGTLFGFEF